MFKSLVKANQPQQIAGVFGIIEKRFSKGDGMTDRKNYCFKLNVQPHILYNYLHNIEELKHHVIPNVIFNSYSDLFNSPLMEKTQLTISIQQDYSEIIQSSEYIELLEITAELAEEYKKITGIFKKGEGIHYNPEYLSKLENAMELRKELCHKFLVLNQANSVLTTSQAYEAIERIYDFTIDSEIGKGLDHLRRVQKIIMYIESELQKEEQDIVVHYFFDSELIVIDDVTKYEAIDTCKKIERQINSGSSLLGNIKINPIYESIVLNTSESMRTIEIITIFPNGNTQDELDILLKVSEQAQAKEVRTTVIAPDNVDNSAYLDGIYKLVDFPSEKGYLSDVKSSGNTIINITNSIIKTK